MRVTLISGHTQTITVRETYKLPSLGGLGWLQIPDVDGGEFAVPVPTITAIAIKGAEK